LCVRTGMKTFAFIRVWIEIKWPFDACTLDRSFTLLAVTWCCRFLMTSLFSLCATLQQVPGAAGGRGQRELRGALLTRDERALDGRGRVPALLRGKLITVLSNPRICCLLLGAVGEPGDSFDAVRLC
jgi:hypothetical protein